MKHIKIFCLLALITFPLQSALNKNIENYFLEVYENEKLEFLDCIEKEGLKSDKQIYTKCKISDKAKDAVFFLYNKKNLTSYDFLDQFTPYKKINKVIPKYPRKAQAKGTEGFVVVEYTISDDGEVLNPKILKSKCGDRRSPFTKYKSCIVFDREALRLAKNLRYEPAKFEGKKISSTNALHSFTFLMEEDDLLIRQRKANNFYEAQKAIRGKNFERAIMIAQENIEFDYMFMSIMASAYYQQGKYLESKEWSNKLKEELLKDGRKIPETMIVIIYEILIASLFNLGEYDAIINLEEEFSIYSKERADYRKLLVMTNFYYGVSYINTGNITKGAYYLGFAAKNTESKDQLDYINSVIDQISSYF